MKIGIKGRLHSGNPNDWPTKVDLEIDLPLEGVILTLDAVMNGTEWSADTKARFWAILEKFESVSPNEPDDDAEEAR